ncbi:MAG TPA: DUF222 domain-containing protein, partial [Marmoricola sp.]|nr:DUF222 domain-containing protein [Marmoricola sp.]
KANLSRVDSSGRDALDVLMGLERQRLEVAAGLLSAAAQFVQANPPQALADFEGAYPLAGEGAPAVAEYSIALVSACLSLSDAAARKLLGDAVELKFRLPRVWALVQELVVPAWKVRGICDRTSTLSLEAASWIDQRLARVPARINLCRVEKLVAEAVARFDPAGFAQAQAEAAEHRCVEIQEIQVNIAFTTPGMSRVEMIVDTPVANQLESTIQTLAHALGELGSTESLTVRRALAVGLLGDPQAALDLMTQVGLPVKPEVATTLYVHVEAANLTGDDASAAIAFEERLGAITKHQLRDWIGGNKVIVRPVIHHGAHQHQPAVDQHDPTETIKEQVVLRNQVCVFPGCNRDSRSCDLDHVVPYVGLGGATYQPGQTAPANLAPLCRYHHRVKTHAGWSYQIDKHGDAEWIDHRGNHYRKPAIVRRP